MKLYSSKEVAEMLGLSPRRVQMAGKELATKVGNAYTWTDKQVETLKARMGKVGRPAKQD